MKYTITEDLSGSTSSEEEIASQLTNIANELAEANRLKRLELELSAGDAYIHLDDEA